MYSHPRLSLYSDPDRVVLHQAELMHLIATESTLWHFYAVSGVGSSPALVTCETSQVLLASVSGDFPGVLPFRPTYRLARLDMSEVVLKGTLN